MAKEEAEVGAERVLLLVVVREEDVGRVLVVLRLLRMAPLVRLRSSKNNNHLPDRVLLLAVAHRKRRNMPAMLTSPETTTTITTKMVAVAAVPVPIIAVDAKEA